MLIYNWHILIVDEIILNENITVIAVDKLIYANIQLAYTNCRRDYFQCFKMVIDIDNIVYPNNTLAYTCLFLPFILFIDVYKVVDGYV